MKLGRLIFALIIVLALGGRAHAQLVSSGANNAPALNPPGGAGNYLSINNPTYTGLMTGPTLNLTGTAPSLTFAGVSMGGACTGVMFVNAISATGIPSCGTPAGSGGGPPLPLSVANGGLGAGTAPAVNQILVASSATLFAPVTMSGDATINAGVITVSSVGGVAFGPLATVASPLPIANGGTNSSTVPTSAQIPIFAAGSYQPKSISGDATLGTGGALTVTKINGVSGPFLTGAAGSITDTMLANAYSGVGACAGGSVATTLNRNAAPTCTTIASLTGGLYAPVTNPAGGSGNYLPISAPTYTGLMTGPQLVLTEGSSGTSLFFGNSTTPAGMIASTATTNSLNFGAGAHLNTSDAWVADATTASFISEYSGNISGWIGTGLTVGSTFSPTEMFAVTTTGFNLMAGTYQVSGVNFGGTCGAGTVVTAISSSVIPTCGTNLGTVYAPLTNPAGGSGNYLPIAGPTYTGTLSGPGLTVTGTTFGFSGSSFGVGSGTTTTALNGPTSVVSSVATSPLFNVFSGSNEVFRVDYRTNQASPWAALVDLDLTVANQTAGNGNANMLSLTANGAWTTSMVISNNSATSHANTSEVYYMNDDVTNEYAAVALYNSGSSAGSPALHNQEVVGTNASNGISLNSAGTGPIDFWINNAQIGQMLDTGNIGFNITTGSLFIGGTNQFRSGTFTTQMTCSTTNPTNNGSGNGQYVTVGPIVLFSLTGGWSSTSGGAGNGTLSGLPFPAVESTGGQYRLDAVVSNGAASSGNTWANRMLAQVANGSTTITFYDSNWSTAGSVGYLYPTSCATLWPNQGSQYWASGMYRYY